MFRLRGLHSVLENHHPTVCLPDTAGKASPLGTSFMSLLSGHRATSCLPECRLSCAQTSSHASTGVLSEQAASATAVTCAKVPSSVGAGRSLPSFLTLFRTLTPQRFKECLIGGVPLSGVLCNVVNTAMPCLCAVQCAATLSMLAFLSCFAGCCDLVTCFSCEFYKSCPIRLSVWIGHHLLQSPILVGLHFVPSTQVCSLFPFGGSLGQSHVSGCCCIPLHLCPTCANFVVCSYNGSHTAVIAFRRSLAALARDRRLAQLVLPHPAAPDPPQVLPRSAPLKAQQARYVANLWTPTSTTARGVGTAAALIAGMPQWPDALLMSFRRRVAPRYALSRPSPRCRPCGEPSGRTCPHGPRVWSKRHHHVH